MFGQPGRIPVTPQHPLGPFLEPFVEPSRPPVTGAVRLEVDGIQDRVGRPGRRSRPRGHPPWPVGPGPHWTSGSRATLGRPAPGTQAARSLPAAGGESRSGRPERSGAAISPCIPALHTGGRWARSWRDRIHPIGHCIDPLAAGDRQHGAGTADLKPWQRLATGDLSQGGGILRPERQIARPLDHASGHLRVPPKIPRPPSGTARSIRCITFDREH